MSAKRESERRVVVLTHYFPEHRGGVEIVAYRLVEKFLELGFHVSWFASDVDSEPDQVDGLSLYPVPAWNFAERQLGFPYPLWSPSIISRLWREIRAAEIVHLHEFIYAGNVVAFLIAKMLAKPVVITQHIGFVPYRNPLLRILLSTVNRTLGAGMLRSATQVVFISNTVSEYFARFVRFRRAPHLIGNGVDHAMFHEADEPTRTRLRQEFGVGERRVFLFVGRFVEKKGLPLLRRLASSTPEILWLFAGAGPLNPREWNLPNVQVYGDKRGASLAELYRLSDLLVLPSKGEGFPLVVQEAMSCGTPVVVSREIAQAFPSLDSVVYAVDVPDSENEFAQWRSVLAKLNTERSQLDDARGRVAQFARDSWSWERCSREYKKVFLELDRLRSTA